jgi:hypothetical protein
MKKRLPIIAVFACAILVMLVLLFMPEKEAIKDTDGDGFADDIDQCIDKPFKTNNGCPEEALPQAQNKEDRDGDGFFLTNMSGKSDDNDSDPCVPKDTCRFCDLDKDGLTLQEERVKQTNPKKSDTDGDGISDYTDACPIIFGHKNNNGCKIDLPLDFTADAYSVSWNPEINDYATSVNLRFKGYRAPVYMQSSYAASEIRKVIGASKTIIELEIELINPKAINLIGNTTINFK